MFRGRVLNRPQSQRTVRLGDDIRFVAADGPVPAVFVTEKYLRERGAWIIHPCRSCGLSELFDVPSDLIRLLFPQSGIRMTMFTSFCPLCGGVQGVESRYPPRP